MQKKAVYLQKILVERAEKNRGKNLFPSPCLVFTNYQQIAYFSTAAWVAANED